MKLKKVCKWICLDIVTKTKPALIIVQVEDKYNDFTKNLSDENLLKWEDMIENEYEERSTSFKCTVYHRE